MSKIVLHCRKVAGGTAEGEALVSKQAISWCGGVDPMTGTISERGHELMGQNIKGKVLVFPTGKGSSAFSHSAHVTRVSGSAPAAIIVREINPQTALGTVVMHIPAVAELDKDPTEVVASGDWVKVDGDKGIVEVTKRD